MSDKNAKNSLKKLHKELEGLWPLAKGSLAEVRKPCIRKGCTACAKGEKHRAFIFSYMDNKQRRCMYVPQELIPVIHQAIKNGRRLEEILQQMGLQLIREYRERRNKSNDSAAQE